MVLVHTNRARAAPTQDTPACSVSTPSAPLAYVYDYNRSARFHSSNLRLTGTFQHPSPCTLLPDLSSRYLPNGSCNGSASCACVGGTASCSPTCTDTFARIALFGTSANAENIAAGYGSPSAVVQGWLDSAGHCGNMLNGNYEAMGVGWDSNYWTQNLGNAVQQTGLVAGGHEPQFSGGAVSFRVNYFDPNGSPQEAQLNLDGTCFSMASERGGPNNATYLATQTLSGTACRRYQFVFRDSGGTTLFLPETGSYGVGGSLAGCPDYESTPLSPCPTGTNQAPLVVTDATAAPNPVSASSSSLSVLGSDDQGEPALTYTWSATGPGSVSFSPNGSNAAKSTTATFTKAGAYTLTATLSDAEGLVVTSAVAISVSQTPTTLSVTPAAASVLVNASLQFAASGSDQFGDALTSSSSIAWTVSGGGAIDPSGLFTAGSTAGGPYTVSASLGSVTGAAQVVVLETPDTSPPVVSLDEPAQGAQLAGRVWLKASATDEVGVSKVAFLWDGETIAEDLTAPYEVELDAALASVGPHTAQASATDLAGNTAQSAVINVTIGSVADSSAPKVSLLRPTEGERLRGAVVLEAEATDEVGVVSVRFEVDGEQVAALPAPPWRVEFPSGALSAGAHSVVARAVDAAGNTGASWPISFEVLEPETVDGASCGCATGSSAASWWLVLFAALLVLKPSRPRPLE